MTTLALFGATGKTGRRVLDRTLAAGHDVRALVRDPAKLDPAKLDPAKLDPAEIDPATLDPATLDPGRFAPASAAPASTGRRGSNLTVIRGDVTDPASVAKTIAGADIVLSLIGPVKGSPKTLQTDPTRVIVEAMTAARVRRIVTLSGGGLRDPRDRPKTADRVITTLLKLLARHVLADAQGHLAVLKASGLEWTVVRAPRLTEAPGTGTYRQGWVGVNTGTVISRGDLADFIVTLVDDRDFIGEMPFVSA